MRPPRESGDAAPLPAEPPELLGLPWISVVPVPVSTTSCPSLRAPRRLRIEPRSVNSPFSSTASLGGCKAFASLLVSTPWLKGRAIGCQLTVIGVQATRSQVIAIEKTLLDCAPSRVQEISA